MPAVYDLSFCSVHYGNGLHFWSRGLQHVSVTLAMESTPLLHKPIVYGSDLANLAFLVVLVLHICCAAVAPISAVIALAAKKGAKVHVSAGKTFVWSMLGVALSGIAVDVVRLSFFVKENHTKYVETSMPSTYPARLGFLFAGLCVLYLLREATPPNVFRPSSSPPGWRWGAPGLLLSSGAALTLMIFLKFNPWTGALWMIWTFCFIVFLTARAPTANETGGERRSVRPQGDRKRDRPGLSRHRFAMASLAAFSWWGALQGFGPAIGIALGGVDRSTTPYVGNQPGPYTPFFWFFLIGWSVPFLIGAFVVRRFKARRIAGLTP